METLRLKTVSNCAVAGESTNYGFFSTFHLPLSIVPGLHLDTSTPTYLDTALPGIQPFDRGDLSRRSYIVDVTKTGGISIKSDQICFPQAQEAQLIRHSVTVDFSEDLFLHFCS